MIRCQRDLETRGNQISAKQVDIEGYRVRQQGRHRGRIPLARRGAEARADGLEHVVRPQVRECAPGRQAVDSLGAGIVAFVANPTQGNVLAHELGHLLG